MTPTVDYTVFGGARSGVAVAQLLRRNGHSVFVTDSGTLADEHRSALVAADIPFEEGGHTSNAFVAMSAVLSPGIPVRSQVVGDARQAGMKILSEVEVAASFCAARQVGITGTNGKTTTTELTTHLLATAGVDAVSAGNVGRPFSSIADQLSADAVAVLELSSYQLELSNNQHLAVAVILNITPDHLDRYDSFDDYVRAKERIATLLSPEDLLILNADDPSLGRLQTGPPDVRVQLFSLQREVSGAWSHGGAIYLEADPGDPTELITLSDLQLVGPHNVQNAMVAALIAREFGCSTESIRSGLRSFAPLQHRLEPIGEAGEILVVNDSKATNSAALRQALLAFDRPVVLIAGGISKESDFSGLRDLVAERVKALVLIGQDATQLEAAFSDLTRTDMAGDDLQRGVELAFAAAEPGDVILLSPACASFDMFDSYEHRGTEFSRIVAKELSARAEEVRDV